MGALLQEFHPQKILDVGGEGFLPYFIDATVVSVNVKDREILYNGERLPFEDSSFDAVVSLDTLEHLPKGRRVEFCTEMVRVARDVVILSAPLGTPEHVEFEKQWIAEV